MNSLEELYQWRVRSNFGETVVAKAIGLSLDRGMKEREMCARLLERLAFVKKEGEDDGRRGRGEGEEDATDDDGKEGKDQNFFFHRKPLENARLSSSMLADVKIDVPTAMEDISRLRER